jgi:hypothetical protein
VGASSTQTIDNYFIPPFSEAVYDTIRANTRLTIYEPDGSVSIVECDCPICACHDSDTDSLRHESGVALEAHESDQVEETKENVTYLDENIGESVGFSAAPRGMLAVDAVTNAYLGNFLKRPVNIATYTWLESTGAGVFSEFFAPWSLFFDNPQIKYKLNNFAFIKCDLKLKVMINASPFYYGAMLMSYEPLSGYRDDTILEGSTTYKNWLMPLSQRPHLWIYPQNSEGGEMTLPFFFHKEWLTVGLKSDFENMGGIHLLNATQLRSATDATGEGVNIQIFAWAENVQLSGPTTALSMQAGVVADEYGQGVVSKPASAIASVASRLRTMPYIGPFARATEIGAKAVGSIASLFGYSNPPVISNVQPLQPSTYPHLASSEISYPVEKLTLDPKNEITVDPSNVGLPPVDELDISSFVGRESFLTMFTWNYLDTAESLKFTARVTPRYFNATAGLTPGSMQRINFTPMCMINQMFQFWRGDIIFRVKVICSQYHKGRLRITWDPYGIGSQTTVVADARNSHLIQTVVVDIGKDTDVEFRVPFHQALPWLTSNPNMALASLDYQTSTFNLTVDPQFYNGLLAIRVLTELTAPAADPTIEVFVFVKGAENLEFGAPRIPSGVETGAIYSEWPVQSGIVNDDSQRATKLVAGKTYSDRPSRFLEHMGEVVTNVRTLLYRYCLHSSWVNYNTGGLPYNVARSELCAFPYFYGYANELKGGGGALVGIDTVQSQLAPGPAPGSNRAANMAHGTYLNWIATCFVGWRGSINWTLNQGSGKQSSSFKAYRISSKTSNANQNTLAANYTRDANVATNTLKNTNSGNQGLALTSQQTRMGLNVSIPFYSPVKFLVMNPSEMNKPTSLGYSYSFWGTEIDWNGEYDPNDIGPSMKVDRYVSAGPDFQLLFFLNCPTRWIQALPADF